MVKGINSFREWFKGYESSYVVIGGTACDLLMSEAGDTFRATRDVDMVLIVEAMNAECGAVLLGMTGSMTKCMTPAPNASYSTTE